MATLSSLGKFKNTGLLLMRIGIGCSFIFLHGYPKLIGGPETWKMVGQSMGNLGVDQYPLVWGLAASLVEAVGGALFILGFQFRPICILFAFVMLVASINHLSSGDGWSTASHAIEVGLLFIGLLFVGPGKYSVDKH